MANLTEKSLYLGFIKPPKANIFVHHRQTIQCFAIKQSFAIDPPSSKLTLKLEVDLNNGKEKQKLFHGNFTETF